MTRPPGRPEADALREDEVAELRAALGSSSLERVERAIEELEWQVAVEDLVILVVDGLAEASRAFFDFIVEYAPDTTNPPAPGERKDVEP